MRISRGKITLEHLQIKNLEKAKRLAGALEVIEEECGIHEVEITINDFFVCPWIDLSQLQSTGMEKLLADLIIKSRSLK